MLCWLLGLALLVGRAVGWATDDCPRLLAEAGASEAFSGQVAHATHSISLRQLRRFKPDVGLDNGIPTVNLNLTSLDGVLPNAPDRDTPDSAAFRTEGMWNLDQVLSHMDEKIWDLRAFTVLERLVHAFHMEEVWARVLPLYEELRTSRPSASACVCARDVEANGVLDALRLTALAIREPGIVNGRLGKGYYVQYQVKFRFDGDEGGAWDTAKLERMSRRQQERRDRGYQVHYNYRRRFRSGAEESAKSSRLLKSRAEAAADAAKQPRLTSEAAWKVWKKAIDMDGNDAGLRDVALYLHCALNV